MSTVAKKNTPGGSQVRDPPPPGSVGVEARCPPVGMEELTCLPSSSHGIGAPQTKAV